MCLDVAKIRNVVGKKILKLIFLGERKFSIFDEKWDHLIILDACRYDFFKKKIKKFKLKGKLEFRKTAGTNTVEWLRNNFQPTYYKDIIYITANPIITLSLGKTRFYKLIDVWKGGWDDDFGTVLPKTVYEYTLDTYHRYPNKKYIIHFLQPHFPYIGTEIGVKEAEILFKGGVKRKLQRKSLKKFFQLVEWDFYIDVPLEKQLKLYEKNLELTLPWVRKIINLLPGKKVVTSDHGEAFGERILFFKVYGHLRGLRIPTLTIVPWFIVESAGKKITKVKRKKIKRVKIDEELIKERLRKLGYFY